MAQEEQTHIPRFSNSSGGGSGGAGVGGGGGGGGGSHRSTKKLKHKKVPQRGMGVAQLEKIILEEQQNKTVSMISPTTSSVPNFRPPVIPLPPPLPPSHHPLIPKTDVVNHVSVSKPTITTSSGSNSGNNWSRLWSGVEYNHEQDNLGGLPYESNPPIWPPLPNITQRSQMFQQPCSSSMVNVSLGTSSSNFQMEPPSNQSYCGNTRPPLWPEEEKMIGMKRSYPFSMENMPIPPFHCKFPSVYVSRLDKSASCSNGGTTASLEPSNPVFRENPLSLGTITDQTTKKFIDDNRGITRDFLTLAPPSHSSSNSKENLPQFEALAPYQGQTRDWSLHSFFPAAKTSGNSNGDAGENVDLNLKL